MLCGDQVEAEDLAFKTIERAIDKIGIYEERDSFYEWLQAILLNLYRNSTRGKMARSTFPSGDSMNIGNMSGRTDGDASDGARQGKPVAWCDHYDSADPKFS